METATLRWFGKHRSLKPGAAEEQTEAEGDSVFLGIKQHHLTGPTGELCFLWSGVSSPR